MDLNMPAGSFPGIRNQRQYQSVCLVCLAAGRPADNVGFRYHYSRRSRRDRICLTCSAEWSISHCWSCQTGRVDSRDPATQLCACGWLKCAGCGSCDWHGCRQRTNPYSRAFTYLDAQAQGSADDYDSQDDANAGWESFVGFSRDDPEWEMMEEIALDGLFERSERG